MRSKPVGQYILAALLLTGITANAGAEKLVAYKITNYAIETPLTENPGDPQEGKKIAIHRKKGNCLACHRMPIPEQADHGVTGTDLNGVASRLSEGQIRLRLVDSKKFNPITMMPSFYKTEGLHRVKKEFVGKTILNAQEVEHVIAYLKTI